jgi:6-pyruvoyltetrahydropterin/6-carboxytetrahydropterin synthase
MSQSIQNLRARVIRRAYFSAAREGASGQMHGHNYVLEAYVDGPVQADSGMVIGVGALKELLGVVTQRLDHKLLNRDLPEFQKETPTAENLARFCYDLLQRQLAPLPDLTLFKVRLFESEDYWVDYGPHIASEYR